MGLEISADDASESSSSAVLNSGCELSCCCGGMPPTRPMEARAYTARANAERPLPSASKQLRYSRNEQIDAGQGFPHQSMKYLAAAFQSITRRRSVPARRPFQTKREPKQVTEICMRWKPKVPMIQQPTLAGSPTTCCDALALPWHLRRDLRADPCTCAGFWANACQEGRPWANQ